VLVSGWREHKEITAAARRTLTALSSRELVSLPPHRVATAQQPAVSVLIDGRRVASLRLGLSIVFDVEALVAGISRGRLSVVHAGRCGVGVALTVHDAEALSSQVHLELPGAFPVGTGIRLLPAHEYPVGVHPGAESPASAMDAQLNDARAASTAHNRFPAAPLDSPEQTSQDQASQDQASQDQAGDDQASQQTRYSSDPAPAEHTTSPADPGPAHPASGGPPPWWDNLQDAGG
jgi:hypothetical protein